MELLNDGWRWLGFGGKGISFVGSGREAIFIRRGNTGEVVRQHREEARKKKRMCQGQSPK
jgi:hypothetical protein